ncbi:hypothetical protein [Corynebacterium durum]|uniref:hypothetical protein n=1 Tax=Corynebacterium durum TaxID=61592 RepID=UPI0028E3A033|nr:hypothetical protein [Corynebacterium durum]
MNSLVENKVEKASLPPAACATTSGLCKIKIITGALPNTNEVADSFVSLVCIPAATPSRTSSVGGCHTCAAGLPPATLQPFQDEETVDYRGVDKRCLRIGKTASRSNTCDAVS